MGRGVPPEVLDITIPVRQGKDGTYHCDSGFCLLGAPFEARKVTVLDIDEDTECLCLLSVAGGVPASWEAVRLLQDGVRSLDNPARDLLGHYYHYTRLHALPEQIQECLQFGHLHPQVSEALEDITSELRAALRAPHQALRGAGITQEYQHLLDVPDAGSDIIVGLPRDLPDGFGLGVHGASIITYGAQQPSGGPQILQLPRNILQALLLTEERDVPRYGGLGDALVYEPTPEDTPEVIEVARTLWNPETDTSLQGLAQTFEAARNALS